MYHLNFFFLICKIILIKRGKIGYNQSESRYLMQTRLTIMNGINQNICGNRGYVHYCALESQSLGYPNICDKDLGGPMMYKINKKWYAYGVSSFYSGFCTKKLPSYYTTVPFYLYWITSTADNSFRFPPEPTMCGVKLSTSRIISGAYSLTNSWPWIVQVFYTSFDKFTFLCQGTLIGNQFVLVNYLCAANLIANRLSVVIGTNELKNYPDLDKTYNVLDNLTISSDSSIIILKLHRNVTTANVMPICLPESSLADIMDDQPVRTAGW